MNNNINNINLNNIETYNINIKHNNDIINKNYNHNV